LNLGFQPYQPNEPGRRKKAGCGRILILESIFRVLMQISVLFSLPFCSWAAGLTGFDYERNKGSRTILFIARGLRREREKKSSDPRSMELVFAINFCVLYLKLLDKKTFI
jgi:hypothetical protein